jgi:hypothetical protein
MLMSSQKRNQYMDQCTLKRLGRLNLKDPDQETLREAKTAILKAINDDDSSQWFKMMGTTEEEVDEFAKELQRIKEEEWNK